MAAADYASQSGITSIAENGFHDPDELRPVTPSAEPEAILAEFDRLRGQLSAGADTANRLRDRVEQLLETSAEMTGELDLRRRQLEAGEEARRQDHDAIARLEEQLTLRTQTVADMKARLVDLMRDFETDG